MPTWKTTLIICWIAQFFSIMGFAFAIPFLKVILARIVPNEQRGSAFGLIGSARSFGWFVGAFSGGIFAAILGLRSVFIIIVALFATIAGLLALLGRGKDY